MKAFFVLVLVLFASREVSSRKAATFGGIVSAVFTPFSSDGRIDYDAVSLQVQNARNVSAVYIAGTTGESMSLTSEERRALAEFWTKNRPKDVSIIVHVGTSTLEDSIALAKHAEGIGADAIGAMPPFFFSIPSVDVLVESMAQIAAAAPATPFFYYHIPGMTHVTFPVYEFLSLAKSQIPTLRGAKFSDYDLKDFGTCVSDGFDMFIGKDEMIMSAEIIGAIGAVGSTYNFLSPVAASIVRDMNAGDVSSARKNQYFVDHLLNLILGKYGDVSLSAQKAIMGFLGLNFGNTVRLPLPTISPERTALLKKDLEQIGFFDFVPPFDQ